MSSAIEQDRQAREEQLDWLHELHTEAVRHTRLLDEIATSSRRTQQYLGILIMLLVVVPAILGVLAAVLS